MHGSSSEQRGGEDWQRRIFRAADLNGTGKPTAAVNENFIHISRTGNVSHLNNRFSDENVAVIFFRQSRKKRVALADSDLQRQHSAAAQVRRRLRNEFAHQLITSRASENRGSRIA